MKCKGTAALVLLACTADMPSAQDIQPARQFQLTLGQRFSATENQAQEPDSAGTTYSSVTTLGFNAITVNELNQLNLRASTALRLSDVPDNDNVSEIDEPRLALSYRRTGATSNLRFNANYRRNDITFLRPLDDFTDENGNVIVPDDSSRLRGSGTRTEYGSSVEWQIRQDAPVSLIFRFGIRGRNYEDVTNPDLADTQTIDASTTARFNFAPGFEGRLNYGISEFRESNSVNTERDRENISFSLEKELSEVLTGTLRIGQTRVETRNDNRSNTTTGGNGGLALALARPNGQVRLSFDNSTNSNGTRQFLRLSRNFLLRDGSLAASIGATRLEDGDREPIGSVRYVQALPTGSMSFAFDQTVRFVDDDSADRDIQTVTAAYNHNINNLSSIAFRAAASQDDDTDRASFSIAYSYGLTEDWDLTAGYSFDRLSENNDDSDRHRIFVGLSRRFDLPF